MPKYKVPDLGPWIFGPPEKPEAKTATMRAPTFTERMWDTTEPLRDFHDWIFGPKESQIMPGPESIGAVFAPSVGKASARAFKAIERIAPEVRQNIWRSFPELTEYPGGSAAKKMFVDPATGDKLMFKMGDQGSDEVVSGGIIHTAENIAGAKKRTPPVIRANIIPEEHEIELLRKSMDPDSLVSQPGSLQRFLPDVKNFGSFRTEMVGRHMRRRNTARPIPSPAERVKIPFTEQEDLMRTVPAELLPNILDRNAGNIVIRRGERPLPIDLGIPNYWTDVKPELEASSVYHRFFGKENFPYLKSVLDDASGRIVKEGYEPYGPFIELLDNDFKRTYARKTVQDALKLLADPVQRMKLFLDVTGQTP